MCWHLSTSLRYWQISLPHTILPSNNETLPSYRRLQFIGSTIVGNFTRALSFTEARAQTETAGIQCSSSSGDIPTDWLVLFYGTGTCSGWNRPEHCSC